MVAITKGDRNWSLHGRYEIALGGTYVHNFFKTLKIFKTLCKMGFNRKNRFIFTAKSAVPRRLQWFADRENWFEFPDTLSSPKFLRRPNSQPQMTIRSWTVRHVSWAVNESFYFEHTGKQTRTIFQNIHQRRIWKWEKKEVELDHGFSRLQLLSADIVADDSPLVLG